MPYYTMPFVEGESLGDRLQREGPLAPREAISVLRDVARALAYAHDRQIIHRDIKPDNIMLSGGSAVVTDFGIAKAISLSRDISGVRALTQVGTVIGTPAYMAPEQVAGDPDLDHRADIYAFGCLAYEVLTGQTPFVEASMHQMFAAHLSAAPEPPDAVVPTTPVSLVALVMQCLEKSPGKRPPSAHAILESIELLTSGGGLAQLPVPAGVGADATLRAGAVNRPAGAVPKLLATRAGLLVLLLLVALGNLVQTALDEPLGRLTGALGRREGIARAMLALESAVRFEGQDVTSMMGASGATTAYFFVFPALLVAIGVALARRPSLSAFRTLVVATTCDYLISLQFFFFFPVTERWSVPESGATLLSNRWSVRLIESIRPMSGLDNSFPSFHVSLIVVGVLLCFLYPAAPSLGRRAAGVGSDPLHLPPGDPLDRRYPGRSGGRGHQCGGGGPHRASLDEGRAAGAAPAICGGRIGRPGAGGWHQAAPSASRRSPSRRWRSMPRRASPMIGCAGTWRRPPASRWSRRKPPSTAT